MKDFPNNEENDYYNEFKIDPNSIEFTEEGLKMQEELKKEKEKKN